MFDGKKLDEILCILHCQGELLIQIAMAVGGDNQALADATAKLKTKTEALAQAIAAAP